MHFAMHERQSTPPPFRSADPDSQSDDSEHTVDVPPLYTSNIEPYLQRLRAIDHGDVVKRTVKYLAVCPSPHLFDAVVHTAPDDVIAAISNAALNVEQGDVELTEPQKNLFRAHRPVFRELTSPTVSIKRKRKVVESQKGGFPFLPILIGSALGALGSRLFGGTSSNQQQ
jgi:hypothetical protein